VHTRRPALALALCALLLTTACAPARPPRLEAIAVRGQGAEQIGRDRAACARQVEQRLGTERDAVLQGAFIGLLIGGFLGGTLGALLGSLAWMADLAALYGTVAGGGLGALVGGTAVQDTRLGAGERALHGCLEERGYVLRERREAR
jgi:hypothetical protein